MLPMTTIVGRVPQDTTCHSFLQADGQEGHRINFAVLFDEYKGPNRPAETHSVYVTMFGPRAPGLAQKLTKGTLVQVVASIKTSKYEKNGTTQYKTDFIAEDVQVLHRPTLSGPDQAAVDVQQAQQPVQYPTYPAQQPVQYPQYPQANQVYPFGMPMTSAPQQPVQQPQPVPPGMPFVPGGDFAF